MIPGFSDVARLPRLGKVRLGEKKKNASGKEYPSALDHFRLDDAPRLKEVYGDKPTELDIMFPVEDTDVFFPQQLKAYGKSRGLFCFSNDGEKAMRVRLNADDKGSDPVGEAWIKENGLKVARGEMFELPCPYQECSLFEKKACKPMARILFMVPSAPGFGCYEIKTTSWNSMVNLNNYIRAIRNATGRISMIPLKLRLIAQKAQVNGRVSTIHVLELVYEGTLMELGQVAKQAALPAPDQALPEEDPEDVPEDLTPKGGEVLDEELGGSKDGVKEPPKASDLRKSFGAPKPKKEEKAKPTQSWPKKKPEPKEPAAEDKPKSGRPW